MISEFEKSLLPFLILQSMQAQYPQFVKIYESEGMDRVDQAMVNLFGKEQWETHCETIWHSSTSCGFPASEISKLQYRPQLATNLSGVDDSEP